MPVWTDFRKSARCLRFPRVDVFSLLRLFSLPKAVKRRINALKQLQVKCAHIEAKFYEEVHDLERKYAALYQPLFDKVRAASRLTSSPHVSAPAGVPWGRPVAACSSLSPETSPFSVLCTSSTSFLS